MVGCQWHADHARTYAHRPQPTSVTNLKLSEVVHHVLLSLKESKLKRIRGKIRVDHVLEVLSSTLVLEGTMPMVGESFILEGREEGRVPLDGAKEGLNSRGRGGVGRGRGRAGSGGAESGATRGISRIEESRGNAKFIETVLGDGQPLFSNGVTNGVAVTDAVLENDDFVDVVGIHAPRRREKCRGDAVL